MTIGNRDWLLLLVVLVTVTGTAVPMAAAGTAPQAEGPQSSALGQGDVRPSAEFSNASNNVSVWDRSVLPLRVDPSDGATQLDIPEIFVNGSAVGDQQASLNKRTLAVYQQGQPITVSFQERTGADTTQFSGDNVQLLVARADPSNTPDDVDSVDTARDIAYNLTSDDLNGNVSFVDVQDRTVSSEGSAEFSVTPSESGQYFFVLARNTSGDGLSVSDGDVSLDGDVDILGVDTAPVQSTAATTRLDSSTVEPGKNVTVNAESGLNSENVTHAVLVVDEDTLADQSVTVELNDEIDANLSDENVTVYRSIEGVNGVARIDGDANVAGINFSNAREEGSFSFLSSSNAKLTDDAVVNASVVTKQAGPNASIDVETLSNFSAGEYTYVYVAAANDGSFSSNDGTVTLEEAEPEPEPPEQTVVQLALSANRTEVKTGQAIRFTVTRQDTGERVSGADVSLVGKSKTTNANGRAVIKPATVGTFTANATKADTKTIDYRQASRQITVNRRGGGGGGGGGGQGGGGDPGPQTDVIDVGNGATVNIQGAGFTDRIPVNLGTSTITDGIGVNGLNISMSRSVGDFRVEVSRPASTPVEGAPELDQERDGGTAIRYFAASAPGVSDDDFDEVEFTFTVSEENLPEGTSSENVALFRYVDGEWTRLPTEHLGGDRYRAVSDGFTDYAIATAPAESTGEPQFDLSVDAISQSEYELGSTTTVSSTVENTGDAEGTFTVELSVGGEVTQTKEVTLGPGESQAVEFEITFDELGEFEIVINGESLGTVSVIEADGTPGDVTEGSPGGEGSGSNIQLIGIALLVGFVLVIGSILVLRRQQQE